ncbi:hypothetical protein Ddc_19180 [Ditylenchus destructor]|nr:hypothetical protein Ddc_19180 [Ditylenchus destructor]
MQIVIYTGGAVKRLHYEDFKELTCKNAEQYRQLNQNVRDFEKTRAKTKIGVDLNVAKATKKAEKLARENEKKTTRKPNTINGPSSRKKSQLSPKDCLQPPVTNSADDIAGLDAKIAGILNQLMSSKKEAVLLKMREVESRVPK